MPAKTTRRDGDVRVRLGLAPDGSGGLGAHGVDLYTRDGQVSDFTLVRGERVRVQDGSLSRAPGAKRLYNFTNNTGAYTFGTTAKYATFTPPLIPKGGFAVSVHATLTLPTGLNVATIVGARPSGQSFHVFQIRVNAAGAVTVRWQDTGATTRTVTTDPIVDGTTVHLLAIYDAVGGTFTVYVNGASSGTPLTGLASTLQPDQTAGVVWTLGVEKETGAAVTANTDFDGAIDALTIFTLRGIDPTAGSPTLVTTLRAHSFREYPNPQDPKVLAHYPLNESSGTTMYDYSRHKNHGTYVGTPTAGAAVALSFPVGNYCGVFQKANGAKVNLASAGGAMFYETVRSGV